MCTSNEYISETLYLQDTISLEQSLTRTALLSEGMDPKVSDYPNLLKHSSSFKQVCDFPIRLCRRGSKDLITWINGFQFTKESVIEIIEKCYQQIQDCFTSILVCLAVFVVGFEVCLMLTLLCNKVFLDPGFVFLFFACLGVSYIILRLLTGKHKTKRRQKSKEI